MIFIIALFLLSSCTYEPAQQGKPVLYIVDDIQETQVKTFVIGETNDLAWYAQTKQQRYKQNLRRSIDDYEDEQEEFELKSKLSNVRRTFDNDFGEKELIIGYNKELDNPDFKEIES